ncbi:hypothetical protein H6G08_11510 [Calothrix anomala FACHB-343]|uniref:Uncharacterized protein n=2 Tax=Calothrix TaxID=1186 RepID=A0ABR8A7G6_9CYAN|nr:hypothetical protein [Calothrix parietina FACHB-288]MBD2225128.1 hypothetical protein [Calothrix anomala FACHB-343]
MVDYYFYLEAVLMATVKLGVSLSQIIAAEFINKQVIAKANKIYVGNMTTPTRNQL